MQALDGTQQKQGLVSQEPRKEKSDVVIKPLEANWPGLSCAALSPDQQQLLLETMEKMLVMFRQDDVQATLQVLRKPGLIDHLYVSWYDGKYDIGSDQVWDTWQIEGPEMVWYFRGQPHIHSYFHIKA